MKKTNPIRGTVENFVAANGRHLKSEREKVTPYLFFNDLENRGPDNFKIDQVFREWAKGVRMNMMKAGTWINEDSDPFMFVQEYVSWLQAEFWKINSDAIKDSKKYMSSIHTYIYWHYHEFKYSEVFKLIYSKVRVFGLRQRVFYLQKHKRSTLGWSYVIDYEYGKMAKKCLYFINSCHKEKIEYLFPLLKDRSYFENRLPENRYQLGKVK